MTSVCSDGEYKVVNTEALLGQTDRQTDRETEIFVRSCDHVMFI